MGSRSMTTYKGNQIDLEETIRENGKQEVILAKEKLSLSKRALEETQVHTTGRHHYVREERSVAAVMHDTCTDVRVRVLSHHFIVDGQPRQPISNDYQQPRHHNIFLPNCVLTRSLLKTLSIVRQ